MLTTGLASDGQEELEFGRQLIIGVKSVREVDSSNTAVGMDLNSIKSKSRETRLDTHIQNCEGSYEKLKELLDLPEGLNVVGTIGSSCEIRQVKLDLITALVKSHGHGADEGLDTGCGLIVRSSESTAHVLVIQHLHLEGEIFLQLHTTTNATLLRKSFL